MTIRIAIVGLGAIAHRQHIPSLAASGDFRLVAAATLAGTAAGIPVFSSLDELLESDIPVDAVAMCQPAQVRFEAAAQAIRANKCVLLEKPPGAAVAEVNALVHLAWSANTTLFAAWHSRYAAGVSAARAWLAERRIVRVAVNWLEDVREWHPGQQWIWEPGGLGVFDAGVNALSILTYILPNPIRLQSGILELPSNRATPIAARLHLESLCGAPILAVFDWRASGPPTWTIMVEAEDGSLELTDGGARLSIDGTPCEVGPNQEYPALYVHFAQLISQHRSEVDCIPLQLVSDAFVRCRHVQVEPFP
jgi:predicted dehydrogenase